MKSGDMRQWRLVPAYALVVVLAGCGGPHLSFLDPQGPIAASARTHFWIVVALMMIAVLPVLLLTPWLVWRYRYRGEDAGDYQPSWSFSWPMEVLVWGGPLVIVGFLAYFLWTETIALDPYKPLDSNEPTLHVDVVGFDWKWLFIYPDQHIATLGKLVVPAGRPVSFRLTSATVLQTFFIPALGSQIDVMNRMVTRLHLKADQPGEFVGRNMQYNGEQFYRQRFLTQALSPADFDAFVAQTRQHGPPLGPKQFAVVQREGASEDAVRQLDQDGDTVAFSSVPSGLFAEIVRDGPVDWTHLDSASAMPNAPDLGPGLARAHPPKERDSTELSQ